MSQSTPDDVLYIVVVDARQKKLDVVVGPNDREGIFERPCIVFV